MTEEEIKKLDKKFPFPWEFDKSLPNKNNKNKRANIYSADSTLVCFIKGCECDEAAKLIVDSVNKFIKNDGRRNQK